MKMNLGLSVVIYLCGAVGGMAADFDSDGVADEFTITRDAARVAKESGTRLVNPWEEVIQRKQPPKGLGLIIRLSRAARSDLLHDSVFFDTPMWAEAKPPVEVITKQDRRYRAWKKQVPGLQGDALQLGTEAGIDILLYWKGKQWRIFWPDEDP